jgi:hypothetical protein
MTPFLGYKNRMARYCKDKDCDKECEDEKYDDRAAVT